MNVKNDLIDLIPVEDIIVIQVNFVASIETTVKVWIILHTNELNEFQYNRSSLKFERILKLKFFVEINNEMRTLRFINGKG